MDLVRVERQGEVARVTLDRPDKLNAVNNAMWDRLGALFAELDADPSLRCVIVAGDGERAFSVGADISEFEENRSSVEQARSAELLRRARSLLSERSTSGAGSYRVAGYWSIILSMLEAT